MAIGAVTLMVSFDLIPRRGQHVVRVTCIGGRPAVVLTVNWISLCWRRDHFWVVREAGRTSQMNLLLRKCRNRLDQRRWVHICVLTN
ncbi:hypothetical protein CVS30_14060 [Arthrobacter psychrolactophilus]|uniref:Uncharacterized protein n=1 Tax=Arthrobacter psychrolactophilus TaxID=92442 RepID=A0A2V5J599_9MICC|nr:hypothetical protein CVS30_14060 [Arthrobacter psychrolactophilus]